jgi:SHS2 domain-containing protein
MPRYEQVEHTADLALRVHGQDMPTLFANSAYAMFCELADLRSVVPLVNRPVTVDSIDHESLLINWLNELLYLHETQGEVYVAFDIHELSCQELRATVHGAHTENIETVIKAATFHNLAILKTDTGYEVTIVFDI